MEKNYPWSMERKYPRGQVSPRRAGIHPKSLCRHPWKGKNLMPMASFGEALLNGSLYPSLEEPPDDIAPQKVGHLGNLRRDPDVLLGRPVP
ncbi:MAG: hypothetical protein MZV63_57690 [Marinilabiliales bacterium]|nr:hypothetical protein [Marinilabiliales bacterium]